MKHRPRIGITSGEIINKYGKWAPRTYGQSYTYSDAVIHAGGTPVILPLTDDEATWQALYELCDGILFAGGNDIDPAQYAQKKAGKTKNVSKLRDAQELALMHMALAHKKPILAICRGMQLLNVARGGSLYQHISDEVADAQNHEISTNEKDSTHRAHLLKILETSQLKSILGATSVMANSHHHQAVAELGKDIVATAWAEDGIVEAIELAAGGFVIGVQPHPESLEASTEPIWAKLFQSFIRAADSV